MVILEDVFEVKPFTIFGVSPRVAFSRICYMTNPYYPYFIERLKDSLNYLLDPKRNTPGLLIVVGEFGQGKTALLSAIEGLFKHPEKAYIDKYLSKHINNLFDKYRKLWNVVFYTFKQEDVLTNKNLRDIIRKVIDENKLRNKNVFIIVDEPARPLLDPRVLKDKYTYFIQRFAASIKEFIDNVEGYYHKISVILAFSPFIVQSLREWADVATRIQHLTLELPKLDLYYVLRIVKGILKTYSKEEYKHIFKENPFFPFSYLLISTVYFIVQGLLLEIEKIPMTSLREIIMVLHQAYNYSLESKKVVGPQDIFEILRKVGSIERLNTVFNLQRQYENIVNGIIRQKSLNDSEKRLFLLLITAIKWFTLDELKNITRMETNELREIIKKLENKGLIDRLEAHVFYFKDEEDSETLEHEVRDFNSILGKLSSLLKVPIKDVYEQYLIPHYINGHFALILDKTIANLNKSYIKEYLEKGLENPSRIKDETLIKIKDDIIKVVYGFKVGPQYWYCLWPQVTREFEKEELREILKLLSLNPLQRERILLNNIKFILYRNSVYEPSFLEREGTVSIIIYWSSEPEHASNIVVENVREIPHNKVLISFIDLGDFSSYKSIEETVIDKLSRIMEILKNNDIDYSLILIWPPFFKELVEKIVNENIDFNDQIRFLPLYYRLGIYYLDYKDLWNLILAKDERRSAYARAYQKLYGILSSMQRSFMGQLLRDNRLFKLKGLKRYHKRALKLAYYHSLDYVFSSVREVERRVTVPFSLLSIKKVKEIYDLAQKSLPERLKEIISKDLNKEERFDKDDELAIRNTKDFYKDGTPVISTYEMAVLENILISLLKDKEKSLTLNSLKHQVEYMFPLRLNYALARAGFVSAFDFVYPLLKHKGIINVVNGKITIPNVIEVLKGEVANINNKLNLLSKIGKYTINIAFYGAVSISPEKYIEEARNALDRLKDYLSYKDLNNYVTKLYMNLMKEIGSSQSKMNLRALIEEYCLFLAFFTLIHLIVAKLGEEIDFQIKVFKERCEKLEGLSNEIMNLKKELSKRFEKVEPLSVIDRIHKQVIQAFKVLFAAVRNYYSDEVFKKSVETIKEEISEIYKELSNYDEIVSKIINLKNELGQSYIYTKEAYEKTFEKAKMITYWNQLLMYITVPREPLKSIAKDRRVSMVFGDKSQDIINIMNNLTELKKLKGNIESEYYVSLSYLSDKELRDYLLNIYVSCGLAMLISLLDFLNESISNMKTSLDELKKNIFDLAELLYDSFKLVKENANVILETKKNVHIYEDVKGLMEKLSALPLKTPTHDNLEENVSDIENLLDSLKTLLVEYPPPIVLLTLHILRENLLDQDIIDYLKSEYKEMFENDIDRYISKLQSCDIIKPVFRVVLQR